MKKQLVNLILFIFLIASCKDKPVDPFENGFAGNWKFVSVTTSSGAVTTNPTSTELITTFYENSNEIEATNGSIILGKYTLSKNKGISISIHRGDFGGWPNGPWLDLYLAGMNKASTYQLNGNQLKIITTDKRTLIFTKL